MFHFSGPEADGTGEKQLTRRSPQAPHPRQAQSSCFLITLTMSHLTKTPPVMGRDEEIWGFLDISPPNPSRYDIAKLLTYLPEY